MGDVAELAALIRRHSPIVVLTGAGVSAESGIPVYRDTSHLSPVRYNRPDSTESGIPDYRSQDGVWEKFDPLEYASIDAFRRDPERVWEFYGARYRMLSQAEPNAAHRAIAELERRGLVDTVITQNIDLLHARAGSRDVIEVHGSIRTATCPACGRLHTLDEVLELAEAGVPRCLDCGAVPKPDVVFFGELLPPGAMERAFALAAAARLLLVVGSTLEVYPVAGLPLETVRRGGQVAIVNRGPTAFDGRAAIRIEGSAGDVLGALVERLAEGNTMQ